MQINFLQCFLENLHIQYNHSLTYPGLPGSRAKSWHAGGLFGNCYQELEWGNPESEKGRRESQLESTFLSWSSLWATGAPHPWRFIKCVSKLSTPERKGGAVVHWLLSALVKVWPVGRACCTCGLHMRKHKQHSIGEAAWPDTGHILLQEATESSPRTGVC